MANLFLDFSMVDFLFAFFVTYLFLAFYVTNLFLIKFMSIGRALFERLDNSHILFHSIASIYSFIEGLQFPYCIFNEALRFFLACNCSCNLETSCSSFKRYLCKTRLLLSKVSYKISLLITSF